MDRGYVDLVASTAGRVIFGLVIGSALGGLIMGAVIVSVFWMVR